MKLKIVRTFFNTFLVCSILATSPFTSAKDLESRYLLFQMFTNRGTFVSCVPKDKCGGEAFYTRPEATSKNEIGRFAKGVLAKIGTKGKGGRKLGFTVGPIVFDMSDEEIRALIRNAFAVAVEVDLAVAIHIGSVLLGLEWVCATARLLQRGVPTRFQHLSPGGSLRRSLR